MEFSAGNLLYMTAFRSSWTCSLQMRHTLNLNSNRYSTASNQNYTGFLDTRTLSRGINLKFLNTHYNFIDFLSIEWHEHTRPLTYLCLRMMTCFVRLKDNGRAEGLAPGDPLRPVSFSFSCKCVSLFKMIFSFNHCTLVHISWFFFSYFNKEGENFWI